MNFTALARFGCFDGAIARRRAGDKRIKQALDSLSHLLVRETARDIGIVSVNYHANGEVGLMAVEAGLSVLLEIPIAHKLSGPDTELARPYFVETLEKRIAQMTRIANDPKTSLIQEFGAEKTREQQVPIIDGLVNDNEGAFQVNVPNHGALPGVPNDVVVEVPAIVNKKGIQPLLAKIMLEQILSEWLEMER